MSVPAGLLAAARELAGRGPRTILGIAGAPGAGKSTLAAALVAALDPGQAVVIGLDGFHLADEELARLGRAQRKGAVDTFDGYGYLALLRRLRAADEPVVYAPRFDRQREAAVAGAIPVPGSVPLVITEGNWLLDPSPPWPSARELIDQTWFLEIDESRRRQRLVRRHVAHGRTPEAAVAWVDGPDQRNRDRIARCAAAADRLIRL